MQQYYGEAQTYSYYMGCSTGENNPGPLKPCKFSSSTCPNQEDGKGRRIEHCAIIHSQSVRRRLKEVQMFPDDFDGAVSLSIVTVAVIDRG